MTLIFPNSWLETETQAPHTLESGLAFSQALQSTPVHAKAQSTAPRGSADVSALPTRAFNLPQAHAATSSFVEINAIPGTLFLLV